MKSVISKNKKTISLENGGIYRAEKDETVADFMSRVRKTVKTEYLEDLQIDKETPANSPKRETRSMEEKNDDNLVNAEAESAKVLQKAKAEAAAAKIAKAEKIAEAKEAKAEAKAEADALKLVRETEIKKAKAERAEEIKKAKEEARAKAKEAKEAQVEEKARLKKEAEEAKIKAKEEAKIEAAEAAKIKAEEDEEAEKGATEEAEKVATEEAEKDAAERIKKIEVYKQMILEKGKAIIERGNEDAAKIIRDAEAKAFALTEEAESMASKIIEGSTHDPVLLEMAKENKGKACKFIPFGLVSQVDGTIIGAHVDKRSSSVFYRIEDEVGILYHKNAKSGNVQIL